LDRIFHLGLSSPNLHKRTATTLNNFLYSIWIQRERDFNEEEDTSNIFFTTFSMFLDGWCFDLEIDGLYPHLMLILSKLVVYKFTNH